MTDPQNAMVNTNTIQSPGANAYIGLQQELQRRAAVARQAQLDEDQRAKERLAAEALRENIATSKLQRESQAQLNAEKANQIEANRFLQTHDVNDSLDAESAPVAVRLFGKGAVNTTSGAAPTIAPAASGTTMDIGGTQTPVDETATVPGGKATFAGDVAERQNAEHIKIAKATLNGDYDTGNETLDQYNKARALALLSGEKGGTIPAGVIAPKTQSEKDSTRYFNTRAAQAQNKQVSGDDAAFADSYEKIHPTEATRQSERVQIQLTGLNAADERQQAGFSDKAKTDALRDLDKSYKGLNFDKLAKNLKELQAKGGVADVVAVPGFLSGLVGGIGAGLRMSQAELNMIQNSRPLADSLKIEAGNLVGVNEKGFQALSPQQREQMVALVTDVMKHNMALAQTYQIARKEIRDANSNLDVYDAVSRQQDREMKIYGGEAGVDVPTSGAASKGVTVTKRK
jgi:hypothetical protein